MVTLEEDPGEEEEFRTELRRVLGGNRDLECPKYLADEIMAFRRTLLANGVSE